MSETEKVQPKRFWINPMGEYGVEFVDGSERQGGCVNIMEAAKEAGYDDWDEMPKRDQERVFENDLHRTISDQREFYLYKMWEHLFNALEGSAFRFWGRFIWETDDPEKMPFGPGLFMDIEYVIPDSETGTLDKLRQHAHQFGAEVTEMWSDTYRGFYKLKDGADRTAPLPPEVHDPSADRVSTDAWEYTPDDREGQTSTQYQVTFDVYGKSMPEVAAVMSAWQTAAEDAWVNHGMNVL